MRFARKSIRFDLRCDSESTRGTWLVAGSLVFAMALYTAPSARGEESMTPAGLALTAGYTPDVSVYGIGVYWDNLPSNDLLKQLDLTPRMTAELAYWLGHHNASEYKSLWHASVTPMLRWTAPEAGPSRFFVEGGVGVGLLSATQINDNRNFGVAFQFDEVLSAGFTFGAHGRYELAAYVEHVSNARLAYPNDGLTYVGATIRAAFE